MKNIKKMVLGIVVLVNCVSMQTFAMNQQKKFFDAVVESDFKKIQEAIEKGAAINATHYNFDYYTALHMALDEINFELFCFLLDLGINPNTLDKEGHSYYQKTSLKPLKASEVVEYYKKLYNHGCKINGNKDNNGHSNLHSSVRASKPEAVKFLLIHDADPNTKRLDGKSPLDSAKQYVDSAKQNNTTERQFVVSLLEENIEYRKNVADNKEDALAIVVNNKKSGLKPSEWLHLALLAKHYNQIFYAMNKEIIPVNGLLKAVLFGDDQFISLEIIQKLFHKHLINIKDLTSFYLQNTENMYLKKQACPKLLQFFKYYHELVLLQKSLKNEFPEVIIQKIASFSLSI